ncbi:hypothetical protein BV20DRAFT_983058 [Pilatotrama ljubarskyi]|nr:hypothetical protein BV20DRAFT_983058 [Pilatotrama ljubarskyi]
MATAAPLFNYEDIPSPPPSTSSGNPAEQGPLPLITSSSSSSSTPSPEDEADNTIVFPAADLESRPATQAQRRRADEVEDLLQHAGWAARRVRLKPSGTEELKRFSQLDAGQREILNAALIIKLSERLETIIPADAQWSMSENLKDKIEQYTFSVLCSPKLAQYVQKQTPLKLVMNIFERHPSWGYSSDIKNDKYKRDIISARVGSRLTDRRSDIKEAILLSLGPELQPQVASSSSGTTHKPIPERVNIVKLCENIIAKAPKSASEGIKVSLQMCVRIAFLRKVMVALLESPTMKFDRYWNAVDGQLIALRTKDDAFITRQLTSYLNADLECYGRTDIPRAVNVHEIQDVADQAAAGELNTTED